MNTTFSQIRNATLIGLCSVALGMAAAASAQAGLVESVYETPGASGSTGVVPGLPVGDQPQPNFPSNTYITTLQNDLVSVAPTYHYTNNAATFTYLSGGEGQTVSQYLTNDAPGTGPNTGSPDGTQNFNVVYDANGYLKVGTTGNYTFSVLQADDAVRVYVDGSHQVGITSSMVAEANYPNGLTPTSGTVTLTAGSYYPFEVFTYQGFGGANLQLVVTGPNGTVDLSAVTFTTPEPASFVLCGLGAIGLFLAARGRRRKA